MARCRFVITLVKDGNEDEYLRETWNSIVFLRNSYISHASKSKRKRDSKAKKKQIAKTGTKNNSQEISAASAPQITSENFSPLTAEDVGSIPLPAQVTPLNTVGVTPTDIVLVGKSQIPAQDKVNSDVVVATSITTTASTKSWAQIASPAKPAPSQAVREKEQERPSSYRESGKVDEDRQKKPKEKKEKEKKKKHSSSSSSSPPAKKPTKSSKATQVAAQSLSENVGLYRKWIRDWFRAGYDLKPIKKIDLEDVTKKNFYVVWEGRARGIYLDWDSCFSVVDKYRGAKYKKVNGTIIEALQFFKEHVVSDV